MVEKGHLYMVMKCLWPGEERNSSKWYVLTGEIGWREFLVLGFLILGWQKWKLLKVESEISNENFQTEVNFVASIFAKETHWGYIVN